MIAHSEGVGHYRKRGANRSAGREETAVDHIEIVNFVGAAVEIQDRGGGIIAHTAGT